MKKLYLFIASVIGALGFTASAQTTTENIDVTFCINIEDPSLCYVQDSNYQRIELQKGDNVFTTTYHKTIYSDGSGYGYSDSFSLYIESDKQSNYMITACDVLLPGASERTPYGNFYSPSTSLYLSNITDAMDGIIFYPTISNLDDLRTATATVNIDDASNVQIRIGSNNYVPELVSGENIIKFNPSTETNWTVGTKTYGTYLGGVKVNDISQTENYGSYYLTIKEGDVIDITAQASIEPVSVSFSFTNEGTEGAISAVSTYINYAQQPVENWLEGFEVDPRTQIIISLDQNTYSIKALKVNDVAQSFYSSDVYITITTDTKIEVEAEKYATFDLNLCITDPSHVTIGVAESQYSGTTTLNGLEAGEQTLQISAKNAYMIINKVDGYAIDRVAYVGEDGVETEVGISYGGYYVPLTGTSKVIVQSHEIARNQTATLWINDLGKCYQLYMQRSDNSYCFHTSYDPNPKPVTGDNEFKFDVESDNPISLYFSPMDYSNPGYVTLNDVTISPAYEGSTSYTFTVADGDVIKMYIGESAPTTSIIDIPNATEGRVIYNIMGVKMQNAGSLTPGLYIINGKKVLVK